MSQVNPEPGLNGFGREHAGYSSGKFLGRSITAPRWRGLQKASTNGVSLFVFELMDSEVVAEVDGCAKETVVIGEGFGAEENAGSGVGATAVPEAGVEGISIGVPTGIVVSVGHDIESAGWFIIGAEVPNDAV